MGRRAFEAPQRSQVAMLVVRRNETCPVEVTEEEVASTSGVNFRADRRVRNDFAKSAGALGERSDDRCPENGGASNKFSFVDDGQP